MSNKTLTLGQAAAWCGGQIAPELEERPFFGANFDSRLIRPGELFAALPGARDGRFPLRCRTRKCRDSRFWRSAPVNRPE